MKAGVLIFIFTLVTSLTYSFYTYSQSLNQPKVLLIKSCLDLKNAITERKIYLQKSISTRMQKNSDIFSSLKNSEEIDKSDKKINKELEKFYEESDFLILEREELVFKLDSLLKMNCDIDKTAFFNKLKIFNNHYKNHLRKEVKLREDFEENILFKIESNQK